MKHWFNHFLFCIAWMVIQLHDGSVKYCQIWLLPLFVKYCVLWIMSWRLCDWLQDSPGYLVPGYAIQRGQNKRFLSLCVWEDALANLNLLVKNPYKSDNWQAVKYLVWSDRSNWNDPYWGKMLVWPLTARQIAHQPFSHWVWIPYSWHIELVIQNF